MLANVNLQGKQHDLQATEVNTQDSHSTQIIVLCNTNFKNTTDTNLAFSMLQGVLPEHVFTAYTLKKELGGFGKCSSTGDWYGGETPDMNCQEECCPIRWWAGNRQRLQATRQRS